MPTIFTVCAATLDAVNATVKTSNLMACFVIEANIAIVDAPFPMGTLAM